MNLIEIPFMHILNCEQSSVCIAIIEGDCETNRREQQEVEERKSMIEKNENNKYIEKLSKEQASQPVGQPDR
jgi:hypothetical protein